MQVELNVIKAEAGKNEFAFAPNKVQTSVVQPGCNWPQRLYIIQSICKVHTWRHVLQAAPVVYVALVSIISSLWKYFILVVRGLWKYHTLIVRSPWKYYTCIVRSLWNYYMRLLLHYKWPFQTMWPTEVLNMANESIVCMQPMKVRSIGNLWKYHMWRRKVLYIAYESKIHNL